MKKIIVLIIASFLTWQFAHAQMKFEEGKWDEVVAKAKKTKKYIFHTVNNNKHRIGVCSRLQQTQRVSKKEYFSKNNLKRVARLRKIIEDNCDYGKDRLDFLENPKRFKKILNKNNDEIYDLVYKIGPPKFIKRYFNTKTTNEFKAYTGKYFGVMVQINIGYIIDYYIFIVQYSIVC